MTRVAISCVVWAIALGPAAASWPVLSFKTESFQKPVVSIARYGETAPGLLFVGPFHIATTAASPMIMKDDGNLIWRLDDNFLAYNVDRQVLGGKPVLTYWRGEGDGKGYGFGYGGVHILDDTYTQIHLMCGDKLNITTTRPLSQPCKLDTHESRITPRGTLLATVRDIIPADLTSVGGPAQGWLLDSVFYELEIPSERVLMRWSVYEHRDQFPALQLSHYPISTAHDPPFGTSQNVPWDFAHMNAVDDVPAPGSGYLVSCRYLWSAIKVAPNGDVEWYLEGSTGGDFKSPRSANFSFQHDIIAANVTSTSMRIHLFDNANNQLGILQRPSSGLLLHLDLANMTVETVQRFAAPNATYSTRTGGYQAINWNDHVLVDYGHPPILNEFDGNGTIVWAASLGDPAGTTYRAYKKSWVGNPQTKPKVVAEPGGSGAPMTTVWASWNGATEVERWEIHGRRNANESVRFLETVPNETFETTIHLTGTYSQVQAKAILANGTVLGVSEMTEVKQASTSTAASLSSRSNLLGLAVGIMAIAVC